MNDIILKNIPHKVYKALQKKANDNHNTIDKIIIEELENITNRKLINDKISIEDWLIRAKETRDKMNFTATEKETRTVVYCFALTHPLKIFQSNFIICILIIQIK